MGGNSDIDITPPVVTTSAELRDVPAPLARELTLATDEPTRVTLAISDGAKTSKMEFDTYARTHAVPVLGLKAGTSHTVSVLVTDQAGNQTDAGHFTISPASLPPIFPSITKNVTGNPGAEPGFLLFTVWAAHVYDPSTVGYIVIMNNDGDVVWYYEAANTTEVLQLNNGHLLIQSAPEYHTSIVEIDMLGRTVNTWITRKSQDYANPHSKSIKVDMDSVHHDMTVMPNGNIITLSTELLNVPNFRRTESNVNPALAPANYVNPDLVEFNPRSGAVENRWSVVASGPDHISASPPIDYKRVGYQSLRNRFWADLYGVQVGGNAVNCGANGINLTTGAGTCYDWAHSSAFWYDAVTDSFLVSVRHLSAIASFQRTTGAMNWILGNHSYWTPELAPYLLTAPDGAAADFWPYYAHRVTMTKARTVMMFDNHNYEAMPPDASLPAVQNNSRVAEYSVHDGQVDLVWQYKYPVVPGDELNTNLYTPATGSALEMPTTGNILIGYGTLSKVPAASIKPPTEMGLPGEPTNNNVNSKHWSRILEVTHDTNKSVLFDIRVGNNDLTDAMGWSLYRATKVNSLYPGRPDIPRHCSPVPCGLPHLP